MAAVGTKISMVRKTSFTENGGCEYVIPKAMADQIRKHMDKHHEGLMRSCLGADAVSQKPTSITIKFERRRPRPFAGIIAHDVC